LTRVYRILRAPYADNPLDGEGAYRFGGRWSSRGTRLAYTAGHLSLAMIEYFVHIDADDPPRGLVVAAVDVPDHISRVSIAVNESPENWRRIPAPASLAAVGDAFVADRKAAILIAPSALAPSESNWLINPLHPDFGDIRVQPPEPFHYDARFFR
jgi:RES domain-containing protein